MSRLHYLMVHDELPPIQKKKYGKKTPEKRRGFSLLDFFRNKIHDFMNAQKKAKVKNPDVKIRGGWRLNKMEDEDLL